MKQIIYILTISVLFFASCNDENAQKKSEEEEMGMQFLRNIQQQLAEMKPIPKDSAQVIYRVKSKPVQVIGFNEQITGLISRGIFITVKNVTDINQEFKIKAIWYDIDNNILGTDSNVEEQQPTVLEPLSETIIELLLLRDIEKANKYHIEISKL